MKALVLSFLILCSLPLAALDRTQVAASAQSVTPLLNGMQAPNAVMQTPDGQAVSLQAYLMQKPTLLLFYRGGWCPYCNQQLAELKSIEAELVDMGYQILAVSPQSLDELNQQKLKTEQAAQLLADTRLQAIKRFGIAFYLDSETAKKYANYGIPLNKDDSGKPVLPAPALFLIDTQGTIQFSYINPDFKVRPSAALVLAAAKALK